MTLRAAYDDGTVRVFHCDHAALAEHLRETGERPDAMIVDAPYSERTHAGHDGGAAQVNRPLRKANGVLDTGRARRDLGYSAMTPADVDAFAEAWAPLVSGWLVSLTDDVLATHWRGAFEVEGRQAFQSIPCCISGMTVRLVGDGPPSEAVYAVVARPRTDEFLRWGRVSGRASRRNGPWVADNTLRGFYIGAAEECAWVGGKPVWLIRALVRDYSRPADLIVDPCCGAGTLGVAVRYEGRRAILADKDPAAVETTIKRLRGERTKPTSDDFPETAEQPSLFAREAAE